MTARQGPVDATAPPIAAILCHYVAEVLTRPYCDLTAVVRYDGIYLCISCAGLRSTVGRGQRPQPISTTHHLDTLACVELAHAELLAAERALHAVVRRARQRGSSWIDIGTQLGTTRQAAQQRFSPANPSCRHA